VGDLAAWGFAQVEARRLDEQRLAATESSEATHVIFTG
jgi:hypothetical protein